MNREEALLIAKYEAALSTGGTGPSTGPEEDVLIQEAVDRSWASLGAQDRKYLARYWRTPGAEPDHKHVFLGDPTDPDRKCITSMDCKVTWKQVYGKAAGT